MELRLSITSTTDDFDRALAGAVFESDGYEEESSDYGWTAVYCGCLHEWHVGRCRDYNRMSVNPRGYVRKAQCPCEKPRIG